MSNANFGVSALVLAEPGGSYDTSSLSASRLIEVLVDCRGAQEDEKTELYTYRLPADLAVQPGDILSVPFRERQVGAIAIRFVSQPPANLDPAKIREIEDVVSTGFFTPTYWQLIERVAQYYYTPLIQAIGVALPPGLLERSQRRIRLTPPNPPKPRGGEVALAPHQEGAEKGISSSLDRGVGLAGVDPFLSPTARQILQLLASQPDGDYSWRYLQRQVKGAKRGLRELLRRGLVESYLKAPRNQRPKLRQAVTLVMSHLNSDLTPRQREVLEVLRRHGGDMWLNDLLQACSTSSSTLKALEQKGCFVIQQREMLRNPLSTEGLQAADQPKALTKSQSQALAAIALLSGYAKVLLHGVTGSGKTEVYLQAIAPILASGKSALVLVPEIGLTPQLTDRFRARFGNKVCIYHSALSKGERYDTWRQMLAGEPQVVIGTRSAVFAPLPKLGLIVLDEEHDDSFKQDQPAPTYHARTVAQWRAELENCPIVLGSATPSLETWVSTREQGKTPNTYLSTQGRHGGTAPTPLFLALPERIQSRPMPPVEVVDMRQELHGGNRSIFSRVLQNALQQIQDQGQQGILFIHRRGHSTFVSCRSCGYVLECPNCDVSLAYHYTHEGAPQLLRCHYCNFVRSHPPACPECSSPYLKFFGSGTQRVAQELEQQFPQLRSIRFDSDTTRTKGSHRTLLTRFANGEADLLVGTQMLTKGLDLPQVTLVGVVAADGLLHFPDYRASERAFQTLTQVAGRSGRGDDPGRVIIQTYTPEHQVIQAVRRHEYQSFTELELQQRAALHYPPYGRLILLRLSSMDAVAVQQTASHLANVLSSGQGYEILGPAPASILRVANRYRWQILLKFAPDALPELPDWEWVRRECRQGVSLTIDVDPLNLM